MSVDQINQSAISHTKNSLTPNKKDHLCQVEYVWIILRKCHTQIQDCFQCGSTEFRISQCKSMLSLVTA